MIYAILSIDISNYEEFNGAEERNLKETSWMSTQKGEPWCLKPTSIQHILT